MRCFALDSPSFERSPAEVTVYAVCVRGLEVAKPFKPGGAARNG